MNKVFKSVKKGQSSFRITKQLCDAIYNKSTKLSKETELVLNIPLANNEVYQVTCTIKKLSQFKGVK